MRLEAWERSPEIAKSYGAEVTGVCRAKNVLLSEPKKEDLAVPKTLIEAGKVTPVIDVTYSLSEVPNAMRYLEQRHPRGTLVITM